MGSDKQALLDVLAQLKIAIEEMDWGTAEQIDKRIKSNIESAVLNAKTDEDKNSLIELLKSIQSLYKLLISNTAESQNKISVELKKITSDKKAANFYLTSSKYK